MNNTGYLNNTNYEKYENVNYKSTVEFTHIRGYASIINYKMFNNQRQITGHDYNLLEPLTLPFGNHLPIEQLNMTDKNPQTMLAWKK